MIPVLIFIFILLLIVVFGFGFLAGRYNDAMIAYGIFFAAVATFFACILWISTFRYGYTVEERFPRTTPTTIPDMREKTWQNDASVHHFRFIISNVS